MHALPRSSDLLRAVAVVHVEVHHGHPPRQPPAAAAAPADAAALQGVQRTCNNGELICMMVSASALVQGMTKCTKPLRQVVRLSAKSSRSTNQNAPFGRLSTTRC